MTPDRASTLRPLSSIRSGERLEIQGIVFDGARARCAHAGIHEGVLVTCLAEMPDHLLLQTASRAAFAFERAWARFVQVGEPARAARRVAGGALASV